MPWIVPIAARSGRRSIRDRYRITASKKTGGQSVKRPPEVVRGNNEGTLIARLIRQLVGIPLFAAEPIPTIVVRSAQNGVYSRGPWSWLCASKWRHFADKLVLVYPFRTPPS